MPAAEAEVRTERADRYLTQLCRHAGHMRRGLGHISPTHNGEPTPEVRDVECSGVDGRITFDLGRCMLRATPERLGLRVEAADEADLDRLQHLLGRRLETIGRRDHLTITWNRVDVPHSDTATIGDQGSLSLARRSRRGVALLVAAIALAAVVHLGLIAGVLTSPLAGVAADMVLVLVVAKAAVVAILGVRRRRARHELRAPNR